jgi:hypothetical protein
MGAGISHQGLTRGELIVSDDQAASVGYLLAEGIESFCALREQRPDPWRGWRENGTERNADIRLAYLRQVYGLQRSVGGGATDKTLLTSGYGMLREGLIPR